MCPAYPVLNYTVTLEDDSGAQRAMVTVDSGMNIIIDGLVQDVRYTYHIRAANQFGNSDDSSPVEICKYVILLTLTVHFFGILVW